MFEVAPIVVILAYCVIAAGGLVLGWLSGILISVFLRFGTRADVKDAILGAGAALIVVIACAIVPWPQTRTIETLGPGVQVETRMNRFQHPYLLAAVAAILLPAARRVPHIRAPK